MATPPPLPQTPLDAGLSLDELEAELARDPASPPAEEPAAATVKPPLAAEPPEPVAPPEPAAPPLPVDAVIVAPPTGTMVGSAAAESDNARITLFGWEPERTPLTTSWLVSLAIHLILILILTLATFVRMIAPPSDSLTFFAAANGEEEQPIELLETASPVQLTVGESPETPSDILHQPAEEQLASELPRIPTPMSEASPEPPAADLAANPDLALPPQLLRPLKPSGGGLEGRNPQTRARLVATRGGTPGSEEAVARALRWLADHQRPGGGWRFDLDGPCKGRCANPGNHGSSTAATGLALLPFLGAGHTPDQGDYQEQVRNGVYYLAGRMLDTPYGGDLQEGSMYAQGIATITLCEAYTLTQDPALKRTCQRAIDFICHAQHPGGGWRYFPGQPGDTTVFGWQLMALKSGQLGKLDVPSPVIEAARGYLDSVQSGNGAYYGYLKSGRDPTPTAVGLLSRMYLGWDQQDPRLGQGVAWLAQQGPSKEDMYFNYYATQVLHHSGSEEWPRWNKRMRDYLVAQQVKTGHSAGSWYFADPHGMSGGRLYCTALATMILEVYYRHMPLYESRAVDEAF